jgi:glyoxylase-like metal-dependent hydrolase (beta-lactamase superfamily II)
MDEQCPAGSEAERLDRVGVLRLRAPNPGPLTLSGTNSWLVGRDPTWAIDPGPEMTEHIDALLGEIERRGGLGGIGITHEHADHVGALEALLASYPAPVAAARPDAEVQLRDGVRLGPLRAVYAPGHSRDHFAFVAGGVCFTGDAVLGEGSVFIAPDPGALAGYLNVLKRLRALELEVLCPGHGPAIWEPRERISQYIEHRLERERRLLAALAEGLRSTGDLLDAAWSEVPEELRFAAAITLQAHLDKLSEEGLLADDVERSES